MSPSSQSRLEAPLVVRVGGLPIDALSAFTSDLPDRLATADELHARLAKAREEAVDRLFEAIGDDGCDEIRPTLLAAKRACFNGRPLAKPASREDWPAVVERVGPVLEEILEGERCLEEETAAFEAELESRRHEEAEALGVLAENPTFRCGLSVASPVAGRECIRLRRKPPDKHGRRERRLTPTLLRYASRAAFKLSPFSTLTSLTLGGLAPVSSPRGFELELGGSPLRSLVRLRRHLWDRCLELIHRYPSVRRAARLRINDSVTRLEDGKSCYVRPSGWYVNDERKAVQFREESWVKLDLGAPVFQAVASMIARHSTYGELVDALAATLRDDDESTAEQRAASQIDQMLDFGWLVFEHPWPTNAGHLEARCLEELRARHGDDPAFQPFLERLQELVELENSLLGSARPWEVGSRIDGLMDRLLQAAGELAGLPSEIEVTRRSTDYDLYQDTWIPSGSQDDPFRLRLDRDLARSLLDDARPLIRYARLFDHRLELMRTLGEWMSRRSWQRRPLMEVFSEFRPLWQAYMTFFVESREGSERPGTWNPLELEELEALDRRRAEAEQALEDCCSDLPDDGRVLDGGALSEVLDRFPPYETSPIGGACLFLQPASTDGSLWMVNRIKEGSGRFGSRYSPVMDPASREIWTEGLRARGRFEHLGETVELLDVQSVQGDTLNVHADQTPSTLVLPGGSSDLPDSRRVGLADLWIHVDPQGRAELRHESGRRLAPAHLGVGYLDYMPTLTKFLCTFGPSEFGSIFPKPRYRRHETVVQGDRTRVGRIVIHRRSWTFLTDSLRRAVADLGEAEAFRSVQSWRREHGIPVRVFARERVGHPVKGFKYQPQYIDFSSPTFVRMFLAMLDDDTERLTLTETMPAPETFETHAFEILLDELALHPASRSGSADDSVGRPAENVESRRDIA